MVKREIPIINPKDEPTTLMGLAINSGKRQHNISEILYPHKAVMCPHCGRIQVTMGEVCFRCRICSKTSSYRKNGKWHIIFRDFPTNEMARTFAKRWSESIAKEKK